MEKIVDSDCGFYQTGSLVAAEDEKTMKELEVRAEATRSLGYTNEILIDKARLKKLAPITRDHCVGGLMSVRDGHASPAETCRAFHAAVIAAGGEVLNNCEVTRITRGENGFQLRQVTTMNPGQTAERTARTTESVSLARFSNIPPQLSPRVLILEDSDELGN